jgi:hypothetical protein
MILIHDKRLKELIKAEQMNAFPVVCEKVLSSQGERLPRVFVNYA